MSGWVTSVDADVAENSHHSGNILTTLTQAATIKQLQRVEGMAMTCSLGKISSSDFSPILDFDVKRL